MVYAFSANPTFCRVAYVISESKMLESAFKEMVAVFKKYSLFNIKQNYNLSFRQDLQTFFPFALWSL